MCNGGSIYETREDYMTDFVANNNKFSFHYIVVFDFADLFI
jgi:hypothetical protein